MKLSIQNLNKSYPNGIQAISQLNLEFTTGMIALLGPNGAGKSTLMRTLATQQRPDSGRITFNGQDIFTNKTHYRAQLGYLPQDFGVYPNESAERLLNYFAILKGLTAARQRAAAVAYVLEVTNLYSERKQKVHTFSGGMKQRFGIAQLLLNQPSIIIVDEPTAGLDPAERVRFLNLLKEIDKDKIILYSTHIVDDVKDICQDMAIIHNGKLLAQIPPRLATKQLEGKIWEAPLDGPERAPSHLAKAVKLSEGYAQNGQRVARIYAGQRPEPDAIPVHPRLEDYYFLKLNHSKKDGTYATL